MHNYASEWTSEITSFEISDNNNQDLRQRRIRCDMRFNRRIIYIGDFAHNLAGEIPSIQRKGLFLQYSNFVFMLIAFAYLNNLPLCVGHRLR